MDEAESLCDHLAIVDGGKIIASGTPAELKAMIKGSDRLELEIVGDAELTMTRLRALPGVYEVTRDTTGLLIVSSDDGARLIPRLVEQVEVAGAKLTSIRLERMTLEDVFIRFTGRRLRDEAARKASFFNMNMGMPPPQGRN